VVNFDDFININGIFNNQYNNSWNFHTNVGQIYNTAFRSDQDVNTLQITSSFDLVPGGSDKGRHSIQFGLQYEGRVNRSYNVAPQGLWLLARQLANEHIPSVSQDNRVVDSTMVSLPGLGINGMFPVYAPTSTPQNGRQFYRTLRESLGVDIDEFVNVDGLSPDQLSLDMFSALELNDAGLVNYLGYDYLGNEFNGTFDEFFTERDLTTGLRTYPVAPNRPQYLAAYLQDKFTFRDIIFRLGVRVDRYDANTKVLRDPYSLYAIQGAGDFFTNTGGEQPANIGDDFAVYVSEAGGSTVQAFRDGDQWYQADGTPANQPTDIAGIRDGLVFPAYENPAVNDNPTFIKDENFTVETSFEDYEVQWNVMPRLAFSFPISDDANFFAHYDVLVQRPASNTIATPLNYFYFVERAGSGLLNNPDLRPQRTVDYEIGFQQRVSNTSAIKLSAYYKEMRDMIQRRLFFPVPIVNQYETFDNQDFGTVKGFSFNYDLRRTNYVQINANYTLQFADGTGSDANSQAGLTNRGNLRTLFPLNFDERHRINLIVDYRLDNRYPGPGFLRNAGINLQTIAVSGRPYTAALEARRLGGAGTQGGINGSRKPWNLTLNLRVDKNFQLSNALGMNVYVRVSNVLDRRNTIAVYPATGSPNDDGFLRSVLGQQEVATISSSTVQELDAYLDSYSWRILNPNFFSLPRRIFAGAIINF
jgi:outer membrane receptor protein involved in Fe transport